MRERSVQRHRGIKVLAGALAAAVLVCALAAHAATAAGPGQARDIPERLAPFPSCGAFIGYSARKARKAYGGGRKKKSARPPFRPLEDSATSGDEIPFSGGGGGSSGTNVQEQGVDEPDIVKTSGGTIFAIGAGAIRAVDSGSPAPRLLDSLRLGGDPEQLLLSGNRLLVFSSAYADPAGTYPGRAVYPSDSTVLTEIDVSNPSAMRIAAKQTIDGSLLDARLTGTAARVVVSSSPSAFSAPKRLSRSRLARWAPYASLRKGGKRRNKPLLHSCSDIERPRQFSGLGMVTVLTIDLNAGLPAIDTDAVMTDADIVYASQKSLYVTSTDYSADGIGLGEQTAVHKFDISSPSETTYVATGEVGGRLLDQFSMSEEDGYLRVAATTEWYPRKSRRSMTESAVSVMKQEGDQLVGLGRVGGLGRGEEVQAVRMFGDRGYVVTYREIDPLYTLDLSDPLAPRVTGELKILGYSAYLHPVSDDLLLGVGVDADDRGRELGALVSLFNVSDPAKPVLISRHSLPGVDSGVSGDHHAFLYWEPASLAVIPVQRYSRRQQFDGALGFRVSPSGLTSAGALGRAVRGPGGVVQRSLVANGRLFALSCAGIQLASVEGLQRQAWIPFAPARKGACSIY